MLWHALRGLLTYWGFFQSILGNSYEASQRLDTKPDAQVVREVRELVHMTRKHGGTHYSLASEAKSEEKWAEIEQIWRRMSLLYTVIMPNYPWSRKHPYRSWIGFLKANALLRQILTADAQSHESQWTEKERQAFARWLRSDYRMMLGLFISAHFVVGGGLLAATYWILKKRRSTQAMVALRRMSSGGR